MPTRKQRPNIVLIHGHDIGRYIGSYGHRVSTPALDALAREGLRFDNYFCPAPQCSPSRASMITGRYPHNSGMMGLAHMDWELNDPTDALPHRLKALGYHSCLFGEQHEASSGEILGYDRSLGTKWPQLAREVAPAFAAELPRLAAEAPFFASVGFFEAHRPFDHPGYEDDNANEVEVLPYLPDTAAVRQDIAALNGRIKAADQAVGAVVEALRSNNLQGDTLVIFTTDHGLAFPRAKGTLYDAGLEIAFIVHWPGVIVPGEPRQELLCNIDLVPTLLELVGAEPVPDLDGRSFLPLLEDKGFEGREHFMCEMTWHDRYAPVRGVRTTRWKYIQHFSEEAAMYMPADVLESPSGEEVAARGPQRASEELYDLESDPLEQANLVGDERHITTLDELRERVSAWMHATDDPLLKS